MEKGRIQFNTIQYNHPLLYVKNKEGALCICIDFIPLSTNTIINTFPIPWIDDILDHLGGSAIFNKINLAQGYHQVQIAKVNKHITALQICFRLFQYHILPFRLCNAPIKFQRLMHKILRTNLVVFCTMYLDNILILSQSTAEHIQHLQWFLQ